MSEIHQKSIESGKQNSDISQTQNEVSVSIPNDGTTTSEEPPLKRQKIKEETPDALPNTSVPLSELAEVKVKVEGVTKDSGSSVGDHQSRSDSAPVQLPNFQETSLSTSLQNTADSIPSIGLVKQPAETKSSIPTQSQPAKADLVHQSGRSIEDIIDGSDLRKFLNKSLTKYIVKGLDEIVELWEGGEFDSEVHNEDKTMLKKKVASKFADVIKQLAEI